MDSTDRFLLGGVLGAALGYLLSQKGVQQALRELRLPPVQQPPETVPAAGPAAPSEPGPMTAPLGPRPSAPTPDVSSPVVPTVAVDEPQVVEAPVLETEAALVAEPPELAEPEVASAEVAAPESAAPEVESQEVEPPTVEVPPVEKSVAGAPVTDVPSTEASRLREWEPIPRPTPTYEAPVLETEAALVTEPPELAEPEVASPEVAAPESAAPEVESQEVEPPEAEMRVTDEFLEEPLPGSGWEASSATAVEEETVEQVLPVAPEEFEPYEAAEVERPPVEHREGPPPVAWFESEIEVPVGVGEEEAVESDDSAGTVEGAQPESTTDADLFESPVADTDLFESPVAEAPAFESPATEAPASEESFFERASTQVPETEVSDTEAPDVEALETETLEVEEPVAEVLETESVGVEAFYEPPVVDIPVVELPVEELPVEELPVEEPSLLESPEAEEAEVAAAESPLPAPPALDTPVMGAPVAEAEPSAEAEAATEELELVTEEPELEAEEPEFLPEEQFIAEAEPMDDLKARIEETRRRIRQELEQPFVSTGDGEPVDEDWTIAPAVAAVEDMATAEPVSAEAAESLAISGEVEVGEGVDMEEPVDYDSMRSRIEVTRSRLKAKAFDAMMTGESALLGRDTEDASKKPKIVPTVDSEVDESIESSLREEED